MQQQAELTLILQPGDTSETVTVSSDSPLIQLTSATVGRAVTNAEIDNLPLVGRDVYQLFNLTPGVQSNISNVGVDQCRLFD